jgi:hypothetical protein
MPLKPQNCYTQLGKINSTLHKIHKIKVFFGIFEAIKY